MGCAARPSPRPSPKGRGSVGKAEDQSPMAKNWETIIGLEVHAQLSTESKIFCGCSTRFGDEPNSNTCQACLGLPGAVPVLNWRAVELGAPAALALGLRIQVRSLFTGQN